MAVVQEVQKSKKSQSLMGASSAAFYNCTKAKTIRNKKTTTMTDAQLKERVEKDQKNDQEVKTDSPNIDCFGVLDRQIRPGDGAETMDFRVPEHSGEGEEYEQTDACLIQVVVPDPPYSNSYFVDPACKVNPAPTQPVYTMIDSPDFLISTATKQDTTCQSVNFLTECKPSSCYSSLRQYQPMNCSPRTDSNKNFDSLTFSDNSLLTQCIQDNGRQLPQDYVHEDYIQSSCMLYYNRQPKLNTTTTRQHPRKHLPNKRSLKQQSKHKGKEPLQITVLKKICTNCQINHPLNFCLICRKSFLNLLCHFSAKHSLPKIACEQHNNITDWQHWKCKHPNMYQLILERTSSVFNCPEYYYHNKYDRKQIELMDLPEQPLQELKTSNLRYVAIASSKPCEHETKEVTNDLPQSRALTDVVLASVRQNKSWTALEDINDDGDDNDEDNDYITSAQRMKELDRNYNVNRLYLGTKRTRQKQDRLLVTKKDIQLLRAQPLVTEVLANTPTDELYNTFFALKNRLLLPQNQASHTPLLVQAKTQQLHSLMPINQTQISKDIITDSIDVGFASYHVIQPSHPDCPSPTDEQCIRTVRINQKEQESCLQLPHIDWGIALQDMLSQKLFHPVDVSANIRDEYTAGKQRNRTERIFDVQIKAYNMPQTQQDQWKSSQYVLNSRLGLNRINQLLQGKGPTRYTQL